MSVSVASSEFNDHSSEEDVEKESLGIGRSIHTRGGNPSPQLSITISSKGFRTLRPVAPKELKVLLRKSPQHEVEASTFAPDLSAVTKRMIDMFFASLLLLLSFPLMILIYCAVRLSSEGPAILIQERLTRGGKRFKMYKFRSMYVTAENEHGAVWAEENDPRVTPIGRFLRKARLDELPQLINILAGQMSIVGPRPERPELAQKLRDVLPNFDSRLAVKAGLTGLAQVSHSYCACEKSYRRKLALDRVYIQKRNALLDLWIIVRTASIVFTGVGAR